MLIKLAWKSFKKQAKGYLLFFFSMVFAVMVYYSFTTMNNEQLSQRGAATGNNIVTMLALGSLLIVLILIFFMLSASRFLIENRRKDVAVFHLYGLKYYQICLLFIFEFLFIGLLSFISGILLGILFSRLFSMVLLKAMDLSVQVKFFFSANAVGTTGLVLLIILGLVSLQTLWLVSGYRLSSFRKEEKPRRRISHLNMGQKVLAILGALLLISGWTAAVFYIKVVNLFIQQFGFLRANLNTMLGIFAVCVVGTYLFYNYTLRWFYIRRTSRSYHNLRVLSRSEGLFRSYRERNFLGTVTIFLGLALTFLGATAATVSIQMNRVTEVAPVSLMMDRGSFEQVAPIIQEKMPSFEQQTLTFKSVGGIQPLMVTGEGVEERPEVIDLVALSTYQKFQQLSLRLADIQLKDTNDAVMLTPFQPVFREYWHYSRTVNLIDEKLEVRRLETNYMGDPSLHYGQNLLVVSDELFQKVNGITYQLEAVNVPDDQEAKLSQLVEKKINYDWIDPITYELNWKDKQLTGELISGDDHSSNPNRFATYRANYVSYEETYRTSRSSAGLSLFVFTFVVMIFIVITASTVSLRQLSDTSNQKERYRLLSHLGINQKDLKQLIYRENQMLFFPPVLLGLIHSFFAIYVFSQVVESADYWFVYLFFGILLIVYSIFFYLTYRYQRKLLL
ncbi:FtsX-like permease family protein [Candidatus Enterococcus ferrettii]|uniref:ABC3 transporter permease C-terminal domain-containing protein n=1 Tax=Candidatus Enterococcus ferrettii TaxID=2815324 RepID=A0ABV0ENI5_9ENTE|nr:FtsX-like permease family protein [Enterococcus sp. 665A]MBO1341281.1 FtsX-like permease family protein [Enterococcus sp. 665A]